MKKYVLLLLAGFILSSCAQDIVISYDSEAQKTGDIFIKPDKPLMRTNLSLNDKMMFENKAVKSIRLEGLPVGPHKIDLTSNCIIYKEKPDITYETVVKENKTQEEKLETPGFSTGVYVAGAVIILTPALLLAF